MAISTLQAQENLLGWPTPESRQELQTEFGDVVLKHTLVLLMELSLLCKTALNMMDLITTIAKAHIEFQLFSSVTRVNKFITSILDGLDVLTINVSCPTVH